LKQDACFGFAEGNFGDDRKVSSAAMFRSRGGHVQKGEKAVSVEIYVAIKCREEDHSIAMTVFLVCICMIIL
jgi:hypothetical protein